MPGRLQKIAALIAAAWAFAPSSFASPFAPAEASALARLDPASSVDTVEIGFTRRLPLGIETTVSMFRAAPPAEPLLFGDTSITAFTRPTVQQGVQAAARYEPWWWLALDFQGKAVHARFADGAADNVPGVVERSASAAATLRMPFGWNASFATTYLAKRSGSDQMLPFSTSTFVNARLSRNLSKDTRVSLDLFNVFNQGVRDADYVAASRFSAPSPDKLFDPAQPRGVMLQLRKTF